MKIKNEPYLFETPLVEGVICKRRNRFIMEVEIEGAAHDCHCPVTGSIGNIVMKNGNSLSGRGHLIEYLNPIRL